MIDFQPYYIASEDNNWDELIQTYWNIQATAKGEIKAKALTELINEIDGRMARLPPDAEEVAAHNPSMSHE